MTATLRAQLPILVVDDDEHLAHTLGDVLRLHGYEPTTAGSGADALALARAMDTPPALAVVDLRLPDMDGLELASQLHQLSRLTQVVILTGNATLDSAVRALRDQSCDYLIKPVAPDQLFRTLQTAEERWQRRVAEEELRRTQELLRAVFEASPLPVVTLDASHRVLLWNNAAERTFGWRANEVAGAPPPFVPPDLQDESRTLLAGALAGQMFTGVEVRRQRRDGTVLDMRLSVAAMRDAAGGVAGVLAVYEDVTDRRRLEEHLRQAQRLDAIGRLAGGIAHDFNNLLTVILGEVDLALREPAVPPAVSETLGAVRATAGRASTLTRQLLAFARRQPLAPAVFDPNAMVQDLRLMLRRLVGSTIRLEERLAPDAGPVRADRGQIEQVVTNLIVNARDAMPNGGTITLATANRVVAESDERDIEPGEWVTLSVHDTGTGMTDEVRERLFEPFFTTKERGRGTGLGLATSYGIMEQSGGRIVVETALGRGSTFTIWLPRSREAADGPAPAEAVPPAGAGTVLIVEDHLELRFVAKRILQQQGYRVLLAANAAEAARVAGAAGDAIDLLITDIGLPDATGHDLAAALHRERPSLKILFVTGSIDPEPPPPAGATAALLRKPYTVAELAQSVRDLLDPGGPRAT